MIERTPQANPFRFVGSPVTAAAAADESAPDPSPDTDAVAVLPESPAEAEGALPVVDGDGGARRRSDDIDTRFGKFILLDELSRSPNGVVYRARQQDMNGRIVALKVLANTDDPLDDRASRFRREVENICKLRHPHIVTVFEVGEIDGFTYFTMEFVEGMSLAEWLRENGPLKGVDAAPLMIKIARAIHFANARGIIHRDIKPGNILLDSETGEPMIVDFGLAKDIRSDVQITQSGVTVGTPPYMPPEQARGQHDSLDSRSDVYALGATLYEVVTGQPPFDGETVIQVMVRVLERQPVRPRRYAPDLAPDLEAIILKCLAKRQRERYDNAELLAQDLVRFSRAEWVHARKATVLTRFGRLLRAYRYIMVLVLGLAVASAGHLMNFFEQFNTAPVVTADMSPARAGEVRWEELTRTGAFRPMLRGNELWLNPPSDTAPIDDGMAEVRVVNADPIAVADFELSFTIDFRERDSLNLGVFLVPDRLAGHELPAGAMPAVHRGFLLMLGCDGNSRTVLFRDGREVLSDGTQRLRKDGEYRISLTWMAGRLEIEVRETVSLKSWSCVYADDAPRPVLALRYFGFLTRGATARISDPGLSVRQRPAHPLNTGDSVFRLGHYESALAEYRQQLYLAPDYRLVPVIEERIALTWEAMLFDAQPELAAAIYEDFRQKRPGASARIDRRLIACYLRIGRYDDAIALFAELVDEKKSTADDRRHSIPLGVQWADELETRARTGWLFPNGLGFGPAVADAQADTASPTAQRADPRAAAQAALVMWRLARRALVRNPNALPTSPEAQVADPVLYLRLWRRAAQLQAWIARLDADETGLENLRAELQAEQLPRLIFADDRGTLVYPDLPRAVAMMAADIDACYAAAEMPEASFSLLRRLLEMRVMLRLDDACVSLMTARVTALARLLGRSSDDVPESSTPDHSPPPK